MAKQVSLQMNSWVAASLQNPVNAYKCTDHCISIHSLHHRRVIQSMAGPGTNSVLVS